MHTAPAAARVDRERRCRRVGLAELHSYGFMLHHRGISLSVDYISQKPLIKRSAAKAFCFLLNTYLSVNGSGAPPPPSTPSIAQPRQPICLNCFWTWFDWTISTTWMWGGVYSRDLFGFDDSLWYLGQATAVFSLLMGKVKIPLCTWHSAKTTWLFRYWESRWSVTQQAGQTVSYTTWCPGRTLGVTTWTTRLSKFWLVLYF